VLIGLAVGCRQQEHQNEIWYISQEYLYSPDGIFHPQYEILAYNMATRQSRVVVAKVPNILVGDTRFSPDGKRVAFVKRYYSEQEYSQASVWIVNQDGTGLVQTIHASFLPMFYWLPNNQLFINSFGNQRYNPPESRVVYDPSMQVARKVTVKDEADSCIFQYFGDVFARLEIQCRPNVHLALGHLENKDDVIELVIDARMPDLSGGCLSWTPDGQSLAFCGTRDYSSYDVFVSLDRGQTVKRLTNFEKDYTLSGIHKLRLSPDGQWVIFNTSLQLPKTSDLKTSANEIMIVSTDSKILVDLGEWGFDGEFVWSPDSRYVAVGLIPHEANPKTPASEIHLIDIQTRRIQQSTFDGVHKFIFDWR
jgi:tricorn protease-like protein